jgi:DNA-binding NtrC family response regulator
MIKSFAKPATRLEITTLTAIPARPTFEIPNTVSQVQPEIKPIVQAHKETLQHIVESVQPKIVQAITHPIDIEKQVKSEPPKLEFKEESRPEPERRKPKANIPEPEEPEDDEDDLDSIKREIMKTLSKLEQAEVE